MQRFIQHISRKILSEEMILKGVVLCVFVVFLLHFSYLMKYSVDIPMLDDWRPLLYGFADSLDIRTLFRPANDTMYSTGIFFDFINVKIFLGNNIFYQGLSYLVIIGGLIWLQYSLINHICSDKNIISLSLVFLLFMLQSETYWGIQSMAYHQAIPLISILSILLFTIKPPFLSGRLITLSVFVIGSIGGLAYISGAIALTVLLVIYYFANCYSAIPKYKHAMYGVLFATLVTLPIQIWVILVLQNGGTHASSSWVLPYESDFWAYFLGKLARSIGFQGTHSKYSIIASLSLFLIVVFYFINSIKLFLINCKNIKEDRKTDLYFVYIAIIAVVGSYLFIVTSGRASLRDSSITSFIDIFWLGQFRFHYFWVTLIFPWLVLILHDFFKSKIRWEKILSISGSLFVVFYFIMSGGVKSIDSYYKDWGKVKSEGVRCLVESINKGEEVFCPMIHPSHDLTNALRYAKEMDLTFTRSLPDFPVSHQGASEQYSSVYILNNSDVGGFLFENINYKNVSFPFELISKSSDPQIFFELSHISPELARCNKVNFRVSLSTKDVDKAQLFYLINGGSNKFNENDSVIATYLPNDIDNGVVEFFIDSPSGIKDKFRLDPGTNQGWRYKLSGIEVMCKK
ncbi:hypothetical protein [Vibrio echinoideorum]|uniref:hypothetical protein n=1 Tax=Vibrio echinoideorum TaxID=2100116 RepID=UPI00354E1605